MLMKNYMASDLDMLVKLSQTAIRTAPSQESYFGIKIIILPFSVLWKTVQQNYVIVAL